MPLSGNLPERQRSPGASVSKSQNLQAVPAAPSHAASAARQPHRQSGRMSFPLRASPRPHISLDALLQPCSYLGRVLRRGGEPRGVQSRLAPALAFGSACVKTMSGRSYPQTAHCPEQRSTFGLRPPTREPAPYDLRRRCGSASAHLRCACRQARDGNMLRSIDASGIQPGMRLRVGAPGRRSASRLSAAAAAAERRPVPLVEGRRQVLCHPLDATCRVLKWPLGVWV